MAKKELSTEFNTRQYMNSGNFEVFFYHDRDLNHVVDHVHPYYEIYFFLHGDVTYEIEGTPYTLQYGDYLLIPPGVHHHPVFHAKGDNYQRFILWISKPCYEAMTAHSPDFSYSFDQVMERNLYCFHTDYITSQEIQGKLLDLIEETRGNKPFGQTTAEVMVHAFLLRLNRITYDFLHQVPAAYENVLYLNICDYINNHLDEDLSLDRLSGFFYSSKYHISHIFKEHMGLSLHQYILKKRLHASKTGVLSGMPLLELCQQYGFTDYTSFYRAFKKEFGLSPKEYREHQKLPEGYSSL